MCRVLSFAAFLAFIACAPSRNAQLVNLATHASSSVFVRIEHPEPFSAAAPPVKMDLEVPPQGKQDPLQEELGYLIGPGDVLGIEVWQFPDVSRDVVVNEEGDIRLPWIKSIRVTGMTVAQLEKTLTLALSQYLVDPSVFITIKEYNSQRVIAMGEVKTGIYALKRKTTLVEFFGQIGGPTDNADVTRLKLTKKDGKVYSYDLNELVKDPQKGEAVFVSGGDTFYVPTKDTKKVYVLGQVVNQKAIDIKGPYRLVDAIADAGGTTSRAVTKSVVVVRKGIGSPKGILINLDQILKKADLSQNIELMPGDIIYVPRSFIANIETFWALIQPPMWWLAMFGPVLGIW